MTSFNEIMFYDATLKCRSLVQIQKFLVKGGHKNMNRPQNHKRNRDTH